MSIEFDEGPNDLCSRQGFEAGGLDLSRKVRIWLGIWLIGQNLGFEARI